MKNKALNVEMRTDRQSRTMQVSEERYRNTDKESIRTQLLNVARYKALMYYGQQQKVDTIIKADKLPDESDDHLSDMKHCVFYSHIEVSISAAATVQADRMYREWKRYNSNLATQGQAHNATTTATKCHKSDNGTPRQTKPIGQP
ncbi:hypothetical protein SARC_03328 [Sphaeroforma arctica JP610]|uniref:Uncharacterized protein n=1 Tax=Sphaeroforma arctica JP610 TaxID=667725 RepID=A0A0L0G696_9EUKA|nr:hypothetical protein SARC_03328 [Sphaeroforma arctica JP610]KNC84464.1 hypothetical protein SARC_03328 [Sphaeroforma arctica JP610]|eukprot:XP_014158366.1 hypothetical protein SARC_03328 [Sphaeroforma arctica JP610]